MENSIESEAVRPLVRVEVLPASFSRRMSGSINGFVWLTIDGNAFPAQQWDDFPVVILNWWLESLNGLVTNQSKRAECNFMDGPFWFEIITAQSSELMLRFYRRSKLGDELRMQVRSSLPMIVETMLRAAKTVIDVCKKEGWHSSDLEQLMSSYSKFEGPL